MMPHAVRSQIATFLHGLPATLAVTLKYADGIKSTDKIRRDLHVLHSIVDRKIYGRHFAKSPIRSSYWGVGEMLDCAPHVHMGWHFNTTNAAETFAALIESGVWERTFARGGTHDVRPINSDPNDSWASYACKALITTDHVIISSTMNIALPEIVVV